MSGWSECLCEVGLHHRKKLRDRYTNNDCRPDIVVFNTDEGLNVDLDVAFAHPWSSEVLSKLAEEDGFAASAREERKTDRQTDRQTDKQTDKQTDTDRQTNRQTNRQTQTDRQTDMIPFNQLVVKYILYLVVSCFLLLLLS